MKKLSYLLIIFAFILNSCQSNAQKKPKAEQFEIQKTEAEWKKELSSEEYYILRQAGTEKPHSSKLNNIKEPGTFVCAACENPLYKTKHKFESGTGWPSFDRPIDGGIFYSTDNKLGYTRNEVLCAKCGGHLGHIFNDGPKETTGKRFCMNGDAMDFIPETK
ncbi:peptide-methionine (R)-S-oxide reductase MsrB [Mesonia mobilis]|uniref:peptide-methionine (R)-S-oxide reductase n=1 Tax=Mesonia mobilis TaxID=369791 RepID=A0ABQ3BRK8_9FLAO|nr:peptide-methionine (R)-S-oxide reductase MsrB [Mesonia mobilis]MBQ0738134.1 peptide-methionine (R)-S-oxide reductase MsrB [Aquimarina celericrescens]GGZ52160.1 peptide-methionine (R)-S-oxide reductase [Mesonia mobilis]